MHSTTNTMPAAVIELQDRLDIINLEALYAKTWDIADADGWAGVFVEDGIFEMVAVGDRQPVMIKGREALATFCRDLNVTFASVHLPTLPYIEVSGDEATGHVNFYYVAIGRLGAAHTMSRTATGHYVVTYRRMPEGWRMVRRVEKVTQSQRAEYFDY